MTGAKYSGAARVRKISLGQGEVTGLIHDWAIRTASHFKHFPKDTKWRDGIGHCYKRVI